MTPTPILISAGEASGDMYAARLAAALQQRVSASLFGMGGPKMSAAGVELVVNSSDVAVVGFTEILRHLPNLLRAMRRLVSEARRRQPPIAIFVDFPSFHLRLARKLRPAGVRNIYFVAPQFWAWRPWRVRPMRRRFEQALCIFPFEEEFFRQRAMPAKFVGHPLVGEVRAQTSRAAFFRVHGLDPARPLVALLPGSRSSELGHHLPVLLDACRMLRTQRNAQFVLATAPGLDEKSLRAALPADLQIRVLHSETYDALAAADVAVVSSGTATIETALLDTPMVVVYRLSLLTALLAGPLVRTPFYSMVNLMAGRRIVPELVQHDFTAERVAAEVSRLLDSAAARDEMRRAFAEVRERLGPPGAVERAADLIAKMI